MNLEKIATLQEWVHSVIMKTMDPNNFAEKVVNSIFLQSEKYISLFLEVVDGFFDIKQNTKNICDSVVAIYFLLADKPKIQQTFFDLIIKQTNSLGKTFLSRLIKKGVEPPKLLTITSVKDNCEPVTSVLVTSIQQKFLSGQSIFEDIIELTKTNQELKDLVSLDWDKFDKIAAEKGGKNTIRYVLANDDIEALQLMSSDLKFNFVMTIHPSIFDDIIEDYTLAEYAALHNSVKCFKFLILNKGLSNFRPEIAIRSGNPEIIRLCQQNSIDILSDNALEEAIRCNHLSILGWILSQLPKIDYSKLFEMASYCNNAAIIQKTIDKITIDDFIKVICDANAFTEVCYATLLKKFDHEEVLRKLLENGIDTVAILSNEVFDLPNTNALELIDFILKNE